MYTKSLVFSLLIAFTSLLVLLKSIGIPFLVVGAICFVFLFAGMFVIDHIETRLDNRKKAKKDAHWHEYVQAGWGLRKDGVYLKAMVDGCEQQVHAGVHVEKIPAHEGEKIRCLVQVYPTRYEDKPGYQWCTLSLKDGCYFIL